LGIEGDNAYRDDLAYVHDTGYGDIARDAATRLIKELAALGCPTGTVIDVGCGSGVLALALVETGYNVIGVDVSEAMVALARTRVPSAEFRIESFIAAAVPASVAVTAAAARGGRVSRSQAVRLACSPRDRSAH
jgi:SAM-dependent methyltransferase